MPLAPVLGRPSGSLPPGSGGQYHYPAERELTEAEPAGGRRPGGTWPFPLHSWCPRAGGPARSFTSGPGPGRAHGVRYLREHSWAHGPSPGRIRRGRSAPPGACVSSMASPSLGRGRRGRAGWSSPRTRSAATAARAGTFLGRLD